MNKIGEEIFIMVVLHATYNELYKEITNDGYREHEICICIYTLLIPIVNLVMHFDGFVCTLPRLDLGL